MVHSQGTVTYFYRQKKQIYTESSKIVLVKFDSPVILHKWSSLASVRWEIVPKSPNRLCIATSYTNSKRLNTGTHKLQIIIYSAAHKNTVCGLRYKTTTQHTKKKKLRKHCTHDNYLQIEIEPVLDGFLKKRHLNNSVSGSRFTKNNLQTPSKLALI